MLFALLRRGTFKYHCLRHECPRWRMIRKPEARVPWVGCCSVRQVDLPAVCVGEGVPAKAGSCCRRFIHSQAQERRWPRQPNAPNGLSASHIHVPWQGQLSSRRAGKNEASRQVSLFLQFSGLTAKCVNLKRGPCNRSTRIMDAR